MTKNYWRLGSTLLLNSNQNGHQLEALSLNRRSSLIEGALGIDYDVWKKRTCCHKFSNEVLEKNFWIFYMESHMRNIQMVFTAFCIIPLILGTAMDYGVRKDSMSVFKDLLYVRVPLFLITIVFLIFFSIGICEKENLIGGSIPISNSPLELTIEHHSSFDSGLKSANFSWYSQVGALAVKYSFWSVFILCCLGSVCLFLVKIISGESWHKKFIIWFTMIHIFCGLGNMASSFLCWTNTLLFWVIDMAITNSEGGGTFRNSAWVTSVCLTLTVFGGFLEFSHRKLFYKQSQLEWEIFKNHALLLNLVPHRVACQLIQGHREAVRYEYQEPNWGASVLFCQICDFEELSNRLSAFALVNYLNKVFTAIDELAARNNVYKVETVKEVYMAATGLPQPDPDHMNQIAHFALDIKECLIDQPESLAVNDCPKNWSKQHLTKIPEQLSSNDLQKDKHPTLMIGINCGTVVAGVIGNLCPRYRLFGDTVNIAARMETNSEKGKIQITKQFKERINQTFQTEDRGLIEIKGKDRMHTYFLVGRKDYPDNISDQRDDSYMISLRDVTSRKSVLLTLLDFRSDEGSWLSDNMQLYNSSKSELNPA